VKTRGGGDGARWTEAEETIYPRGSTPEFWHADARRAALERLKAGVTTGLSIFGAYGSRADEPIYADRHCEGYREVGVRSVLAVGSSPPPFPQCFARWQDEKATHYEVGFDRQVATCETVINRWHGAHDNAIRITISAPVWFPGRPDATPALAEAYPGQAAEMRALSRRHAIGSVGTAPDRSYDMFRHMWQAMHYHRRRFRDASILPPGKALNMITIDAARALGLEAELGSLESGRRGESPPDSRSRRGAASSRRSDETALPVDTKRFQVESRMQEGARHDQP